MNSNDAMGGFGGNVIILGVDMCSSVHVDNKKKDILILGKGLMQGLGKHSLTTEKIYSLISQWLGKNLFNLAL